MPTGINFGGSSAYDISYPELNDIGQIAFRATTLTGSGVDPTNNSGIWLDRSGSLALVVREGDHPPGMPSGVTFGAFGENSSVLALNNASQIAFRAPLTGTGVVPFVNDAGIWSEGSGSLALVARTGDPAPGLPSGVNFDTILHPALNNQGQIAFQGYLVGTGVDPLVNSRGIWFGKSGSLAMVARAGDHAPGAADGVNFSRFYLNVLNDAGQIAFGADLTDNRYGIWATDRSGAVQVIALEGGPLEVAPGDFRTINDLQIGTSGLFFGDLSGTSGNSDGRSSAFNNRGQFAFYATFTDGSRGIFVSNRVAIPEPATIALAASALGVVTLLRGARRPHKH
jgi:hypothetical protein